MGVPSLNHMSQQTFSEKEATVVILLMPVGFSNISQRAGYSGMHLYSQPSRCRDRKIAVSSRPTLEPARCWLMDKSSCHQTCWPELCPWTHMVEGENNSLSRLTSDLHLWPRHLSPVQTTKCNLKKNLKIFGFSLRLNFECLVGDGRRDCVCVSVRSCVVFCLVGSLHRLASNSWTQCDYFALNFPSS